MWTKCLFIFAMALLAGIGVARDAQAQASGIVAIGDSNTAGFGVGRGSAFPAILEETLQAQGFNTRISNQGISGDTTGGMLARLDSAVPPGTRLAIVQGGYNDQRRGASSAETAANIDAILARLKAQRVRVILCGLTNQDWRAIARRHGAVLVPASTCYDAASRGFDGLHMNAAGHRIVASRLSPTVKRLLGRR